MNTENIIIYNNALLRLNADAGGGLDWNNAKITAINQDNEKAIVKIHFTTFIDEIDMSEDIVISLVYKEDISWLIDIDTLY